MSDTPNHQKGTTLYVELPTIHDSTPDQRLQALKDAKQLMSGAEPGGFAQLFSASAATPGPGREAIDGFIRLAEYITTGHDYADTHPKGKRRPIIKKETHVHVHPALVGEDGEVPDAIKAMVDHLVEHIENGDFDKPAEDEDPKQDEDQRPSFE